MHTPLRAIVIRLVGFAVVTGAVVALVASLAAGPTAHWPRSGVQSSVGSRATTTHFDTSQVKEYASLAALRQDASSVGVLKPTGATTVQTVDGVPFTVATVTIVQTISGMKLPATLELRQTGNGSDPTLPLVSDQNLYLAYLQPFQFQPGVPVGDQYVVVGVLQGLFENVGGSPADAASASYSRVDPEATGLPPSVTTAQAAAS
jgi:hypothetical protein